MEIWLGDLYMTYNLIYTQLIQILKICYDRCSFYRVKQNWHSHIRRVSLLWLHKKMKDEIRPFPKYDSMKV
jgi:hypothetical protein